MTAIDPRIKTMRVPVEAESDKMLKARPGFPAVHEINEVVNQLVAPAFDRLRFEPGFGGAVEENDGEREPEPAEASGESHEV